MEINSGHSNVQIAIAVQPQNAPPHTQGAEINYGYDDGVRDVATQVMPSPSVNTSGQEVGNLINTWA